MKLRNMSAEFIMTTVEALVTTGNIRTQELDYRIMTRTAHRSLIADRILYRQLIFVHHALSDMWND